MKHLKKSFILLVVLTVTIGSRTSAQDYYSSVSLTNHPKESERAREVMQDNEYTGTGYEVGNFYTNPLLLDGKPLDYDAFNLQSKGELTVIKGAALTGATTQITFYIYLRRDGHKVFIPDFDRFDGNSTKIEISRILRYAKSGDLLVIEPVSRADGPVKRILKLLEGC